MRYVTRFAVFFCFNTHSGAGIDCSMQVWDTVRKTVHLQNYLKGLL